MSRTTVAKLEQGKGTVASLMRLLAVLALKARRRTPERLLGQKRHGGSRQPLHAPPDFIESIYAAFGPVDLDPCAHRLCPVVAHRGIFNGNGGDGLAEDWSGGLVFVNPPFSELLTWLRPAHEQWRAGNAGTVICLVPVRTDSAWFHETLSADADIYLLRGRVRFLDTRGKGQPTPFSLMLLTLDASAKQKARYAQLVPEFCLARSLSSEAVAAD